MTTTVEDLIQQTKGHLLANTREEINVLVGPYTAGGGTLTFRYPLASIQPGADIEIDQEVFRVMSVTGLTAQVIGGQLGSASAHHDDGALVTVNPRFYRHRILTDLGNTIQDMVSAGLYREVTVDVTDNPVLHAYDITGSTTVLRVLEVRYQEYGPSRRHPVIERFNLMQNSDTSIFPSGNALALMSPGGSPGLPIRIRYAAPYGTITAVTDDVDTHLGIPPSAQDLPPMGAAVRQMLGRDIKRSFLEAQPDTRRSTEVPPGVSQQAMRSLQIAYQQGIDTELARLSQRNPYRRAG